MNKRLVPAASALLLVAVFTVFSQEKARDYSGTWKLDLAKSEMGEGSRVESMNMTVTQTGNELGVELKAKPESLPYRVGKMTYDLSGKATEGSAAWGGKWYLEAEVVMDGKLYLRGRWTPGGNSRGTDAPTFEIWSLSDDGKTLTVRFWLIHVTKFYQKLVFARQ